MSGKQAESNAWNKPSKHHPHRMEIRQWPKFVFLYPTFLATIAMGVLMHWWPEHGVTGTLIFLGILFANMGVLALFLGVALVGATGFLVDYHLVHFLPWAISLGRNLQPIANEHVYFTLAAGMVMIYAVVFIIAKGDCWEVPPGNVARARGSDDHDYGQARSSIDIPDRFEWLLLGSGRLTAHLKDQPGTIVLENVPRASRANRQFKAIMNVSDVHVVDGSQPR